MNNMKVWIVGAGPGDPDLLTVKAKELLERAEVLLYAGSLVPPPVIALAPRTCERIDSAGLDFEAICDVYTRSQARGVDVLRLHSGDPSLFGAIGEQISWLEARGIDFEIVPGVSSFLGAAAALKKELTAAGVSQTVVLTRMGGRTPGPDKEHLRRLSSTGATVCLFLSMTLLSEAVEAMLDGYGSDVAAAVVARVSRSDQKIFTGKLSEMPKVVLEEGISMTALLIAGPALAAEGAKSLLYSSSFSHACREAGV